ncbi:MAG: hypothetical protein ABR540_03080 [Acidimicrobiales bacterium]
MFRAPGLRLSEMLTLKDQTDATGRLLLEDSAPKRAIKNARRNGVRMKTVPCPYADTLSRHGDAINISAYEALRHDVGDMLNGLAWLTRCYLESHPGRRSTPRALFELSSLGVTLPLVLFNRRPDPVDPHGRLPSYVASLCKASRGIYSASVDLLNREGDPMRTISAAEMVAFAEAEGHFSRPVTQRACAAPTRLIERTIAVILTGEGGNADNSKLGELVDFPTLWQFWTVQDRFSRSLSDYKVILEDLVQGGEASDPRELFASRVQVGDRTQSFGLLTEGLLAEANGAQGALNQLLGRAADAPPVSFEDILRML